MTKSDLIDLMRRAGLSTTLGIELHEMTPERVVATMPITPHHHQPRSEEHTSELQSRQYLVCRLLLEKKKKHKHKLCAHAIVRRISSSPQAEIRLSLE